MNSEPVFLDYIAMLHELNQRANEQGVRGFELIDGDFIRMQSESLRHAVAKRRIADLLDAAVPEGSPCRAFVDGPTVVSRTDNGMIPDAVMQCEPIDDDTVLELDKPVVIVEVLSPSNRPGIMEKKRAAYFKLNSLHHYIEVDLDQRHVDHYRQNGPQWLQERHTSGVLTLDPPAITLEVDVILDQA